MIEWISVKDRLPEVTKLNHKDLVWEEPELLLWEDSMGADVGWYKGGNNFCGEDDCRLIGFHDVTHWQYITPPKEVGR